MAHGEGSVSKAGPRPANFGKPAAGMGRRRRVRQARACWSGEEGRRGEDAVGAANLGSEEGAAKRERRSESCEIERSCSAAPQ